MHADSHKPMADPGPQLAYQATVHDLTRRSLAQMDDAELIARVLADQAPAFEALMDRYMPLVIGYLLRQTRSEADSEDLAQEIFLTAYRSMGQLRSSDRLASWLLRIARNRLTDFRRASARRPWLVSGEGDPERLPLPEWENAADQGPSPAEQAARSQTCEIVIQEIARLGETYCQVLLERLIKEDTCENIGRRMGLLPITVRMRLYRGLEKLRHALIRRGIGGSEWGS